MPEKQRLVLERDLYRQDEFDKRYPFEARQKTRIAEKIRAQCYCSKKRLGKFLATLLPIIGVLRRYRLKEYIGADILAGLTVAIMHIPQGLGFGILASLKPIHGLYSSFWPVLFYMIFGTSTHVSFGTNAVICLLIAGITSRKMESFHFEHPDFNSTNLLGNDTAIFETMQAEAGLQYRLGLATAAAFMSGLILLGMGIFRLGFITLYLSDSFISGFTTGAAVHIATSQVPKMLAFGVGSIQGAGKIVRTYIAIFANITKTNIADFIIGVICMIVLMLVKECINERFKSKMKMPVPIDLIVVIVATIISHFARFYDNFGVVILHDIPTGIPTPAVPALEEVGDFAVDSFVIAILIFAMTIAMAKLMAKKHSYELDDNQELVAYGLTNFLSSFLLCFPSCVAPPRTMLQSAIGAKTLICGFFTAALLFLVLMVIGPLFASLPVSVLAAMIIVSMKGLFMQVLDLRLYWKVNVFDFITWLITFLAVVLIDIDIGLAIGIVASAFTVIIQSQFARGYLLGKTSSEDVITNVKHVDVSSVPGVQIFRFESSLYFATAEIFRSRLYGATIHPKKLLKTGENSSVHHVIIDCSPITYVDIAGIKMLQQIIKEFKTIDIGVFLSACSSKMRRALEAAGFFETFSKDNCFVDIFDALETARNNDYVELDNVNLETTMTKI